MIALIANFVVIYLLIWASTHAFKSSEIHRYFLPAVAIKILAGIILGLVYMYHYQGGDTWNYFEEARKIIHYSRDHPSSMWGLFFGNISDQNISQIFQFSAQPRAFFFAKIVAIFYLATGGNYWLISVYYSLISAVACFYLAEKLLFHFPQCRLAIVAAVLFFPSFIFWSSGLIKESIAVAAICFLAAETLTYLRTKKIPGLAHIFLLLLAIVLIWKLKYFYAAVLVPILLTLLVLFWLSKGLWNDWSSGKTVGLFSSIFLTLLLLVSQLHYNLQPEHIIAVVYDNYKAGIATSEVGKTLRFNDLRPTLSSFIIHVPEALFGGLFRPNIWDWKTGLQNVMVAENFLLILLFFISLIATLLRRPKITPLFWASALYVILLSVFLAFSSPNFGTLSRYKVGFEPFFIFIVLALNPLVSRLERKMFSSIK